jgi:hypothetical protein
MSVSLEVAVQQLKAGPLADPSKHLKVGGRAELLEQIERLAARGLRAHVLVADRGDPLPELLGAWQQLGLDERQDLLLVFDTQRMRARGWGLDDVQIQGALDAARARWQPKSVFAAQLISSLQALARVVPAGRAVSSGQEEGWGFFSYVGGAGALVATGLVALAIRRRMQLGQSGAAQLAAAQASAERTYTELILACEELPAPADASELQLRAAELKRRLDSVVGEVRASPTSGNDPVRIGEIGQLENEMSALRSTVLQKLKEGA